MNRKFHDVLRAFFGLLALAVLLASCDVSDGSLNISADTYTVEPGERLDAQKLIELFVTDTEASSDISPEPSVTTEPIFEESTALTYPSTSAVSEAQTGSPEEKEDTVYWVSGGEVWHTKSTCASLSRSKNILSGTVEDAILAGKARVCKRCG